jgi:hypothetical protein
MDADRSKQADERTLSKRQLITLLGEFRGNMTQIERATGKSRRQLLRWVEHYGLDLNIYRHRSPKD